MGEMEEVFMEPVWNKKWGNSSSEILDGFAFNSFSDATICCNGKRIPVHQMVLAASSDYFREILDSSMSSHPFIMFENVNLKTLEQLLMFIYRGQVFVRPQETRSLFRLAEDFKVKGLSGPIGSDMATKHDFDPPGVDVLNLNLFRKCVSPTKIRDVDILRCKISGLIQKTPRKTRITELQMGGDFKVSKVKDNKYKIVGCNRTRIYDKEEANAAIHQESSETAREREIFDQFSHISLVEDKSKTFTEEAVKDLVTRLTSNLTIKEGVTKKSDEEVQLIQEPEMKVKSEECSKELQLQSEQPQTSQRQESKSVLSLTPFRIEDISSALELSITQESEDKVQRYLVKTTEIPVLGIPTCPTTSKVFYSCDLCTFTSSHQSTYERHRKVHSFEQHKPLLERIGREKLISRIEKLRNYSGFPESKPKLDFYSSMSLLERCQDGSSTVTCTASTSKPNDGASIGWFLGSSWEGKSLISSTIRNHLQDIYDSKKKVNSTSCSVKGHSKDNVSSQRYGRRHRRYICLYCSHKTYHKKNLIEHQKVHLRKPEKPNERRKFVCQNCPFQSHSELYLSLHMRCCRPGKTKDTSPTTQ